MHTPTLEFYSRHARTLAASYTQAEPDYGFTWKEAFPTHGSRILDIGCGAGRDLGGLIALGYDAWGVEPVLEMRLEAIRRYPKLAGRIVPHGIPLPRQVFRSTKFDGVLCAAVLMHLSVTELQEAVHDISRLLKDDGRLIISLPAERSSTNRNGVDDSRLFLPSDLILSLFKHPRFFPMKYTEHADALGRPIRWKTILLAYQAPPHRSHPEEPMPIA